MSCVAELIPKAVGSILPLCIPVAWETAEAYWLAYHHAWRDQRLYSVVQIKKGGPQSVFDGYVATVDDFGNLVPTVDDYGRAVRL